MSENPKAARALPVKMGATGSKTLGTLWGDVALDDVVVSELREYDGGEVRVSLRPGEGGWALGSDAISGAELWFYGTRRLTVEPERKTFLDSPEPLGALDVEETERSGTYDVRLSVGSGTSVTMRATHAVLRASVD